MMWFQRNPFKKSGPPSFPPMSVGAGLKPALTIFFALSCFWAAPLFAHDGRPVALRSVDLEQKLGSQVPLGAGVSRRGGTNGSAQ